MAQKHAISYGESKKVRYNSVTLPNSTDRFSKILHQTGCAWSTQRPRWWRLSARRIYVKVLF